MKGTAPPPALPTDDEILTRWRAGKDTLTIARELWVPEWQIACHLPRILQRARQDQEWNFDGAASAVTRAAI